MTCWVLIEFIKDRKITPTTELLLYNRETGRIEHYYALAFYTNRGRGYFKVDEVICKYSHYAIITPPKF